MTANETPVWSCPYDNCPKCTQLNQSIQNGEKRDAQQPKDAKR